MTDRQIWSVVVVGVLLAVIGVWVTQSRSTSSYMRRATSGVATPPSSASVTSRTQTRGPGALIGRVIGTRNDGSTYRITATAEPVEVGSGLSSGDQSIVESCPFDPQRDAVLPIDISLQNTTASLSLPKPYIRAHLSYGNVTANDSIPGAPLETVVQLSAAERYSSGTNCDYNEDESRPSRLLLVSTSWNEDLAAGSTDSTRILVVIHNYISPDAPNGIGADMNQSHGLILWFQQIDVSLGIDRMRNEDGTSSPFCAVGQVTSTDPGTGCFGVPVAG